MAFKQALNTSAGVWQNATAYTVQLDGHEAMLRTLVTFLANKPTLSVTYVGTGDGQINYLDGGVGGVTQTWTITLTTATTFTVSGSISGAQAGGTVGVNYTTTGSDLTSLLSFVITAGATPFVNTDAFTVSATANTIPAADVWVLDAWNNFDLYTDQIGGGLWWHGEGDGTQAIYCGIRLETNAGLQIWNWVHRCATGFSPSQTWSVQPGVSDKYYSAFVDTNVLYWIIGSGRRYCVGSKSGSTYHGMYQGLFLPFGSPAEYPLPIANLGQNDVATAYNSGLVDFNVFCFPDRSGEIRTVDGLWLEAADIATTGFIQLWPAASVGYNVEGVWDNHENYPNNGDHILFPIVIIRGPAGGISVPLGTDTFGVLDGVRRVTGFGNAAETILTISAVDHVVLQNTNESTRHNFWTMEMA